MTPSSFLNKLYFEDLLKSEFVNVKNVSANKKEEGPLNDGRTNKAASVFRPRQKMCRNLRFWQNQSLIIRVHLLSVVALQNQKPILMTERLIDTSLPLDAKWNNDQCMQQNDKTKIRSF